MLNSSGTSIDCGSNDISQISTATLGDVVGDKKPYTTAAACPNTSAGFKLF